MEQIKKTRLWIVAVALLAFTFSCKKTEEVIPDFDKLITQSIWSYDEEVSLDPANAGLVNTLLNGATLTFKTGGSVESFFLTAGTNTWEFNADKTKVIIDKGLPSEDEWTVVSLTETEFIYRDNDDGDEPGGALPFSLADGKPLELKFIH